MPADWILLFLKSSFLGLIDLVKSAAWLQVMNEPSSHYVCSKNATPFSGGSGTGKLSSWVINARPFSAGSRTVNCHHANWPHLCTQFVLILSWEPYNNDTTNLAVFSMILWLSPQYRNRERQCQPFSVSSFSHAIHLNRRCPVLSWSPDGQPEYNRYNFWRSGVTVRHWVLWWRNHMCSRMCVALSRLDGRYLFI